MLEDYKHLLECELFNAVEIDGSHSGFVDDEALLKPSKATWRFKHSIDASFAGRGLVVGVGANGKCGLPSLALDEVAARFAAFRPQIWSDLAARERHSDDLHVVKSNRVCLFRLRLGLEQAEVIPVVRIEAVVENSPPLLCERRASWL
jgi:hypothetical protein